MKNLDNMEEIGELLEEKFKAIKLEEGQEKVIFGLCAVIDNNTLKVTTDLFADGSKISIVKVINSVKDDKEAKDFNDVINYFKNEKG